MTYKPSAEKALPILIKNLPLEELEKLHELLGKYLKDFSPDEESEHIDDLT